MEVETGPKPVVTKRDLENSRKETKKGAALTVQGNEAQEIV